MKVVLSALCLFLFFLSELWFRVEQMVTAVMEEVKLLQGYAKTFVFGEVQKPVTTFKSGVHTIYPEKSMAEDTWKKYYRVSFMTGWRNQPIHIEN
jgi:hypothetical protein